MLGPVAQTVLPGHQAVSGMRPPSVVMGTVTAMTETSVSVKTMNGTDQTIALSNNTKLIKGENAISAKDIKVGDHVVIHASKKDGKLVAAEVKVGAVGSMKGMHGDMSGMDMSRSSSKPQ